MLYITLFHQMENLAILASARKVNDYENMFRQELENISVTVSALACARKPKKRTPNTASRPEKSIPNDYKSKRLQTPLMLSVSNMKVGAMKN